MMKGVDAVQLIDKPAGKTSHDVVAAIRREHGGKKGPKVGHAGTLDPFATGLLLVLLGRATRIQRYLMALPKAYATVARFGAVSTTGDRDGEIVETGAAIPDPLVLPRGEVRQRPPAYSAVKVGGERAYRLARRGEAVEIPERTVNVYRCDEVRRDPPRVWLEIECSAGTYVRSLVADLGDAYCEELRRTAIGPFSVEDAGATIGLGEALEQILPVRRLEGDEARRAAHGVAIPADPDAADGPVALFDDDGPIAIAEPRADAQLKPTVGFRSA
jgi:tRNA pseudouridine55 synthase